MLYIDGQNVVDNNWDHGPQTEQGTATLTAGLHEIVITFYENGGGAQLLVSWTPSPGAELEPLSGEVLSNLVGCGPPNPPPPPPATCDGNSLLFEAYDPGDDVHLAH